MAIIGMPETIFDALKASEFNFYLTGSRYFGEAVPDSDWDFFVENKKDVIPFLENLAFFQEQPNSTSQLYHDSNCLAIFKCFGNIHIQIVASSDLKIRQQELLKGFPFGSVAKMERAKIWDWARDKVFDELKSQFDRDSALIRPGFGQGSAQGY